MIKKIFSACMAFLFSTQLVAAPFQLLATEKDEYEEDTPQGTTYTYTAGQPLVVDWRYGFNIDMDRYELAVKFSDDDTRSTQLKAIYLAVNDDQVFYPQLNIPNYKPQYDCYFYGQAEVILDDVWIVIYDFADGQYGAASLKSFKVLGTQVPELQCMYQ